MEETKNSTEQVNDSTPETTAPAADTPNCYRTIDVTVPAEEVQRETESLVSKYQKVARIPGFRAGKVPATVVRSRFASELKSEAAENLINRYAPQEIERQGLKPVSQPRIVDLHMHDGESLHFKATFEVLPEIEVSGYKELGSEPVEFSVADQEVEDALANIREQHASYNPVTEERGLAEGDYAQVSFEATPKGEAEDAQPVSVPEVMIEIGGSNTVKEFTENLRGAKPGEQRSFDVSYPEDFADSRLAGKNFAYTVTVSGIKTKTAPEYNDEFAKQLGEFANMDEVRNRIREGIEHDRKHRAEHEAKDKIVDELLKRHDFPVPEALVEATINQRLERGLRALAAQGMRSEDLKRMDFSRLREGQREAATREVKASLILDKIAEVEKIEVSDEELEREIEAVANQTRRPVDEVRERLTEDGSLERIKDSLRNQKTLDTLYRRPA